MLTKKEAEEFIYEIMKESKNREPTNDGKTGADRWYVIEIVKEKIDKYTLEDADDLNYHNQTEVIVENQLINNILDRGDAVIIRVERVGGVAETHIEAKGKE